MYQVIARKYRPQSFADVVNQEHVKTTLENAIAQNRIAHGYIFSGQRGTGKTTVARILARCLNCVEGPITKPCGVCASCLEITAGGAVDVIEIDAASNRGINEMRELRENVRYRPARDRYKVFIIDEAHQITSEAFNALLKTIEEPPPWVVFVLCTTEAHKIPATIASRCQHFSFRSVEFEDLVARMAWICGEEGIEAGSEALAILAKAGEGSVRDSLSALDQAIACCGNRLEAAEVRRLLGSFGIELLDKVTQALAASASGQMLEVVDELERNGHNLQHFARELARWFRNLLVARISGPETRLIAASPAQRQRMSEIAGRFSEEDLTRYLQLTLDLFKDLQFSLQPRFHLEIGLVRLVHAGRLLPIEEALAQLGPKTNAPAGAREPAPVAPPRPSPFELDRQKKAAQMQPAPAALSREAIHAALMEQGLTFIADAVEHAELSEAAGALVFTAPREFKLSLESEDLKKVVRQLAGKAVNVRFAEGDAPAAPMAAAKPPDEEVRERALQNPEVQRFQQVFGGEVRQVRNLKE